MEAKRTMATILSMHDHLRQSQWLQGRTKLRFHGLALDDKCTHAQCTAECNEGEEQLHHVMK
jgi:hypothetical protein